jgi:hypothetical protein
MIKIAGGIFIKTAAYFQGTKLFTPRNLRGFIDRSTEAMKQRPTPRDLSRIEPSAIAGASDPTIGGQAVPGSGQAYIKPNRVTTRKVTTTRVDPVTLQPIGPSYSVSGEMNLDRTRRKVIAHEAFHAGPDTDPWYRKVPGLDVAERLIRKNEPLAYAYGGFKGAPKGSSFLGRLRSSWGELQRRAWERIPMTSQAKEIQV